MIIKFTRIAAPVLMLTGILFSGCSKNDIEETTPTSLTITLKDESGNPVAGAPLSLSRSLDYNNPVVISTQTSGADGTVTFTGLDEKYYYSWLATKDCISNCSEINHTHIALTPNKANTVNQVLYRTGLLELTNTSSTNYSLSSPILSDPSTLGGHTSWSRYVKEGSYNIHCVPINTAGPAKDTLINIVCGGTTSLAF